MRFSLLSKKEYPAKFIDNCINQTYVVVNENLGEKDQFIIECKLRVLS